MLCKDVDRCFVFYYCIDVFDLLICDCDVVSCLVVDVCWVDVGLWIIMDEDVVFGGLVLCFGKSDVGFIWIRDVN